MHRVSVRSDEFQLDMVMIRTGSRPNNINTQQSTHRVIRQFTIIVYIGGICKGSAPDNESSYSYPQTTKEIATSVMLKGKSSTVHIVMDSQQIVRNGNLNE